MWSTKITCLEIPIQEEAKLGYRPEVVGCSQNLCAYLPCHLAWFGKVYSKFVFLFKACLKKGGGFLHFHQVADMKFPCCHLHFPITITLYKMGCRAVFLPCRGKKNHQDIKWFTKDHANNSYQTKKSTWTSQLHAQYPLHLMAPYVFWYPYPVNNSLNIPCPHGIMHPYFKTK